MNRESYYLPLNSTGLAHYFSRACVIPSIYLQNRPQDIQDLYPDVLLIASNKWVKGVDCSLELVLTADEEKQLIKLNDYFFLFETPLPITRIKKVYFKNLEKKEQTEWNINSGAAVIPHNLMVLDNSDNSKEVEAPNDKTEYKTRDWAQTLKKYDQLLGSMAFMKLGGEFYMNYSPNYFQTLSFVNRSIKEELIKQNIEPDPKQAGIFTGEGPWSKLTQLEVKKLSISDVENYAKAEGIKLEKKLGNVINYDSINESTQLYMLAVLATYGDGKIKKTDDLITDIWTGKFDKKKVERITLLFGYHNGYTTLRNKYRIGSSEKIVKFELNSKLDYYTIESIYQFAFNKNDSNWKFSYLDEWCPTLNEKAKGENFKVLDKVIITKKKPRVRSKEYLEEFFPKVSFSEVYAAIADKVRKWLPPYAKITKDEDISYFDKELSPVLYNKIAAIVEKVSLDTEKEIKPQIDDLKSELEEKSSKCTELEKVLKSKEEAFNELEIKIKILTKELELLRNKSEESLIQVGLNTNADGSENNQEREKSPEIESNPGKISGNDKDLKKKASAKKNKDKQGSKKSNSNKDKVSSKTEEADIFLPETEKPNENNIENNLQKFTEDQQ